MVLAVNLIVTLLCVDALCAGLVMVRAICLRFAVRLSYVIICLHLARSNSGDLKLRE